MYTQGVCIEQKTLEQKQGHMVRKTPQKYLWQGPRPVIISKQNRKPKGSAPVSNIVQSFTRDQGEGTSTWYKIT
jgi:hypothetical protein